jgi:hypothetical protein
MTISVTEGSGWHTALGTAQDVVDYGDVGSYSSVELKGFTIDTTGSYVVLYQK